MNDPVVLEVISTVNAVNTSDSKDSSTSESHLEDDSVINMADHLEVITSPGGRSKKIRILDNNLRIYLCYHSDTRIISDSYIECDSDSTQTKEIKKLKSIIDTSSVFHHISSLKEPTRKEIEDTETVKYEVYTDFVKIIEDEFERVSGEARKAFSEGLFTFDQMAVALTTPAKDLVYYNEDALICIKTTSAKVVYSMFGSYLNIRGKVYSHNGRFLVQAETSFNVPAFQGKKTSEDIRVYDLDLHPQYRDKLIARGRRYIEITKSPSYMHNKGSIVRKSYWGPRYFKSLGRVMVDTAGMRRVDQNYDYYFAESRYRDDDDKKEDIKLTEDVYLHCIPYVYGFSLTSKIWGEMLVDNLSNIEFRSDAYDKLVLDKETKRLIFSLVDTDYQNNSDLINGKGGGCIFLLEGDPGVGKTLTSEAIAENLKRPLYMVSVGELGTDVDSLEENLREILETAASWNAVLLIDEADIFLEARTDMNIERNAMVGVFLRLLEYYEGILFLTTNRAANIDQAFFSRISVAIHYTGLEAATRLKIWKTLLKNSNFSEDIGEELYHYDLNGRQIKNCIRNAGALAKAENRQIEISDFITVINTAVKFDNHLKACKREIAISKMGFFEKLFNKIDKFFS